MKRNQPKPQIYAQTRATKCQALNNVFWKMKIRNSVEIGGKNSSLKHYHKYQHNLNRNSYEKCYNNYDKAKECAKEGIKQ
jgi:hypothetical protein